MVLALLVHRRHMPPQVARPPEGSRAVRTAVGLGVRGGTLSPCGALFSRHDRDGRAWCKGAMLSLGLGVQLSQDRVCDWRGAADRERTCTGHLVYKKSNV